MTTQNTTYYPNQITTPPRAQVFPAKERNSATGLDYFGARYYSSGLSVWLSVDPLADKHPNFTPYAYVYNNTIMYRDLWGLEGIKDPNGNEGNAGTGYKQTADKKYLYDKGLKTKVWDPDYDGGGNQANGLQKGGYVDYNGPDIDFENYGKLSVGKYDRKTFSSIKTEKGKNWYGSSWSITKYKYSNSDYLKYYETAYNNLKKWGKAYQDLGLLMGGISATDMIKKFSTHPIKFVKSLSPTTLIMTHLYLMGVKTEKSGEQFKSIFMRYINLHRNNPSSQQDVYLIEEIICNPIPMFGGTAVYQSYIFYDISTGKFLGQILYP